MSANYSDRYIYAFDTHGKEHLIFKGFYYNNSVGDTLERIRINGREFERETYISDDWPTMTCGEALPCYFMPKDFQSYFTAKPTFRMKELINQNEMSDANFAYFADMTVKYFPAGSYDAELYSSGPYGAECWVYDKNGYSVYKHDVEKESLGDDVETVIRNLLKKYSPDKIQECTPWYSFRVK